jgi:DNA-binding MarR family transcriptional regulator
MVRELRLIPSVHRATHRVGLYLAAGPARSGGLSQGESHILALLAAQNSRTVGALHAGLAHKRSTLTSILNRLEARGLITRAVGKSDRRTFIVTLTTKGRRVARAVFRRLDDLERAVAAQTSTADLAAFARVAAAIETEAHERARGGRTDRRARRPAN